MAFKDKEKLRAYQKAYREKNKAKVKAWHAAWWEANKKTERPRKRAYWEANRDYLNAKRRTYSRTLKGRYGIARHIAKTRHIAFDISFEEYAIVITPDAVCHYCTGTLPEAGGGLDRKDNEPFYRIENVVPCCTDCNQTFGDRYTYKEKLILAEAVKDINCLRKLTTQRNEASGACDIAR